MRWGPLLVVFALALLAGCSGLTGLEPPTDGVALDDPATDRIGWERGYWHNDSLAVTNDDGLTAREREAVVARATARVEFVRNAEFAEAVPVDVVSRATYRNRSGANHSAALRTFDNAKFEAMFLVGEDADSIAVQEGNSGSNVLGYYVPANDSITLVAGAGGGPPVLDGEGTLAHELVHALQDQRHNLSTLRAETRDAVNAQNALVEGEATVVQERYSARCGEEWTCISGPSSSATTPADFNWGVYYLTFFPYSEGPGLVRHLYARGGWPAVDAAFADLPASAEQAIYPRRYTDRDPPVNVSLADRTRGDWTRVRPPDRPDYAVLGQSALTSTFAATLHDRSKRPVIAPRAFVNVEDGGVNASHPFDYGLSVTEGWEGDRLHVYQRGTETAYVWRIAWDSPAEAREFLAGYRDLLGYWNARRVDGRPGTWRIPRGSNGFADAFAVSRDGATVTVVNAPTVAGLDRVRADG
ncbi:MAG: Hvo_1808 family surface protein [Halorientalis sp.]